jgi:hypothetical protein
MEKFLHLLNMIWPPKFTSDEFLENAKRELGETVVHETFKAGGNMITASIASSEQKILDKIGTPPRYTTKITIDIILINFLISFVSKSK